MDGRAPFRKEVWEASATGLERLDWSSHVFGLWAPFHDRGPRAQASSATRRGGSLAKNVIIPFRPSRSCMTILPSASSPVNLKDALGDIEPNRDSVHDGRSPRWVFSTRKLGAADVVGGRPPSIARSRLERSPSLRGAKRRSNPAESLGALRPSGSPGPRGSSPRVLAMTIMVREGNLDGHPVHQRRPDPAHLRRRQG